jgi:hypothetical protein
MTNAEFARQLRALARCTASEISGLLEGMWNPGFCAADADVRVARYCADMRALLDALESFDVRKEERERPRPAPVIPPREENAT